MRLPNGYGTIYNLGKNRRRPWIAKKYLGRVTDDQGRQRSQYGTIGYYATQAEALDALAEFNRNPHDLRARRLTFEEVYSEWSAAKYPQISASMASDYKGAFKYCKAVHQRVFAELTAYDYEGMVQETEIPRSYLHRINVLLSQMYQYAMKHEIVNKDISKLTEIREDNDVRQKRNLFTADDIHNLLAFQGDTVVDMILVSLYTGMRPTEICNIRSSDIDIFNRTIRGGIKTKAGKNRLVPIHSVIVPLILDRLEKAANSKREAIFLNENGDPMSYKTYRLWFSQMYPDHTPYDTRHTFASAWHLCGLDPLIEKLVMGHAVQDITKGVYTHIPTERLVEEIDKLRIV